MTYTLAIGSVSSGTLRSEDLLDSFAWELEQCVKHATTQSTSDARQLLREIEVLNEEVAEGDLEEDSEGASDLVDDCIDELNNWCPPYCYFGAHEGDGAAFGCWPLMDSINELPKVSDPSELEDLNEDEAVFVNDHGNVTLYYRDQSGEWKVSWSIV